MSRDDDRKSRTPKPHPLTQEPKEDHGPPEPLDKVVAWRFEEMLRHGLDTIRAGAASSDPRFDLERFRALCLRGCDPTAAYDIVR